MRRQQRTGQSLNSDWDDFAVMAVHCWWSTIGPVLLMLFLLSDLRAGTGWLSGLDIMFLLVVALMVCARGFEQLSGKGTTMYGEPSTWKDFRCFALVLPHCWRG
jgi:hypothetical protein